MSLDGDKSFDFTSKVHKVYHFIFMSLDGDKSYDSTSKIHKVYHFIFMSLDGSNLLALLA